MANREDLKRRNKEKHLYRSVPTTSQLVAKIETMTETFRKKKIDVQNRDDNKEVALGTSKINYMDPRIRYTAITIIMPTETYHSSVRPL